MTKYNINKKGLVECLFVIVNILVMIVCAYHLFKVSSFTINVTKMVYCACFLVSFGIYSWLRYRDETNLIGAKHVTILLAGLLLALFGGSNVVLANTPMAVEHKVIYFSLLIVGAIIYLYEDYKSNILMEGSNSVI